MPSFEEDAFSRAQQMHSKTPYYSNNQNNQQNRNHEHEKYEKEKPQKPPQKPEVPVKMPQHKQENLLDTMFKNKDQSLILLLIILLMEENAEPTILLALMYLLI